MHEVACVYGFARLVWVDKFKPNHCVYTYNEAFTSLQLFIFFYIFFTLELRAKQIIYSCFCLIQINDEEKNVATAAACHMSGQHVTEYLKKYVFLWKSLISGSIFFSFRDF